MYKLPLPITSVRVYLKQKETFLAHPTGSSPEPWTTGWNGPWGTGVQQEEIWTPSLFVTLALLNLSGPQSPHLQNEANHGTSLRVMVTFK